MKHSKLKTPRVVSARAIQTPKILNEYSSMNQCSSALGIPLETIKFASKNGCEAFRHHRINTLELIRWIFARGESDAGINWGDKLNEYKAKREKVKLDIEEKRVANWDDVTFGIDRGMAALLSQLDKLFSQTFPPALKGLSEKDVQKHLEASVEPLKKRFRDELEKIGRMKPKADEHI